MRALALAALLAAPAAAQEAAPYAGLDARDIAALSAEDVAALERGAGWGLAKPAELNGWPGPAHILELGDALDLTAEQEGAIRAIWTGMDARARTGGPRLIAAEAALDAAFADGTADAAGLPGLIAEAEAARALLREVHLAAHLEAAPILTRHQTRRYAALGGYEGGAAGSGHGGH